VERRYKTPPPNAGKRGSYNGGGLISGCPFFEGRKAKKCRFLLFYVFLGLLTHLRQFTTIKHEEKTIKKFSKILNFQGLF